MTCETCGKQKLKADMAVSSGWLRDHGDKFCCCVSFVSIATTQGTTGCTQDAYDRIGTVTTSTPPAPATCSEVVERMRDCVYEVDGKPYLNGAQAEGVLHSWRERRVQELEELIAKRSGCSHCNDSASGITSANDSMETRRSK